MAEQSSCMGRDPFERTALKIQFRVEVCVCIHGRGRGKRKRIPRLVLNIQADGNGQVESRVEKSKVAKNRSCFPIFFDFGLSFLLGCVRASLELERALVLQPPSVVCDAANLLAVVVGHGVVHVGRGRVDAVRFDAVEEFALLLYIGLGSWSAHTQQESH